MKFFIVLASFSILLFTNANSANANCSGGDCDFNFSNHYKYAKTHCMQTLSYENVETYFSYFTIIKTGQKCEVTESSKEKKLN
jgi:hypothetical protein|tara:strand:+ start:177 stop:425 length:249 start_codon:yes stop_codon:yes gene_type:complete